MKEHLNIALYAIDDDAGTRASLKLLFEKNNIINYTIYNDPVKLLETLHTGVQVCIIDYDLKNDLYNGLTLMKAILKQNIYCKCIIMSGYEQAKLIKEFLNSGAFRYVTKGEENFSVHLIKYINKAMEEIIETFNFYMTLSKNMKENIDDLKDLTNG